MKPTLPFAQYDKDTNHLHILHKDIPKGVTNLYSEAFLRQQQADKDRTLRVLKEVDEVLLNYIEQLEKKPMTTLAHGRGVVLAVKYMIAVLEER